MKIHVIETREYTMGIDPADFPEGYDLREDPELRLDTAITCKIEQGEDYDHEERSITVIEPNGPDLYYIRALVERGQLSPGALTMDPARVVEQYNEANALDEWDRDYLYLPSQRLQTV